MRDTILMMPTPEIPAEQLAEMTLAVRAFVASLLVSMDQQRVRMQAEMDELKAQVNRLTPEKSSMPPSTQPPLLGRLRSRNPRRGEADKKGIDVSFAN